MDPTNVSGQATTLSFFTINPTDIKVNVSLGGIRAESSDTDIAAVSVNSSTGTVTVTGKAAGSATIKVYKNE